MAIAVRVDKMADFGQELLDKHCLIETQAVLGLLGTHQNSERYGVLVKGLRIEMCTHIYTHIHSQTQ